MYRVVKMSSKYFAIKVDIRSDQHNIDQFMSEGRIVILVDDLESLSELGINPEDVEVIKPD